MFNRDPDSCKETSGKASTTSVKSVRPSMDRGGNIPTYSITRAIRAGAPCMGVVFRHAGRMVADVLSQAGGLCGIDLWLTQQRQ